MKKNKAKNQKNKKQNNGIKVINKKTNKAYQEMVCYCASDME